MNIGIDLGTTNSALAFIDPVEAADADFPPIHVLDIPQFIAPGQIEPRRTLPSFLFLGDQTYLGAYAREQGALVPTKSGLMLGLGETLDEVRRVMLDLRAHHVDILTLGQYLRPSPKHLPIIRYVPREEFDSL